MAPPADPRPLRYHRLQRRRVLVAALLEAAQSKDIIADILNVGIEALVKARYELPAFSTLRRAAQKARAQVNHRYYHLVYTALDDTQRGAVTRLLSRENHEATSQWQHLKREPKQPTIKHLREHLAHVRWLQSLNTARQALQGIPETKLQRFADEAQTMDASRMKATQQPKQVTLAVALIRVRTAQTLDDVADMLIRRMQQLHHQGQEALQEYRNQHQEQTDALIVLLGQLLSDWQANETPEQRLTALTRRIVRPALAIMNSASTSHCPHHRGSEARPCSDCELIETVHLEFYTFRARPHGRDDGDIISQPDRGTTRIFRLRKTSPGRRSPRICMLS